MAVKHLVASILYGFVAVEAGLASRWTMAKNNPRMDQAMSSRLSKRDQPSRPSSNAYLNNKTQPYWVNGSALPEVDFDIGESYAGMLPIDDTGA